MPAGMLPVRGPGCRGDQRLPDGGELLTSASTWAEDSDNYQASAAASNMQILCRRRPGGSPLRVDFDVKSSR